jgi:hypothetical protein
VLLELILSAPGFTCGRKESASMRMLLGSLLVVMGFVAGGVVIGLSGSLIANNPGRQPLQSVPSDQLIAFSLDLGNSGQQVTLIDTSRQVMGVYHIDRTSGEISLKCVRNTHWDLLMDEFNGVSPSPREIRSLLQR